MKTRTIEEIHDKYIGHKKFAWFVDTAIKEGHTITNIKEYNEKYKFEMDNYPLEFDKNPKVSAKWQLDYCYKVMKQARELERLQNGK